jgi:dynein heavy chain
MGDFIFDKNQKFYFSRSGYSYKIPEPTIHDKYMEAIMKIPLNNSPEVFGLHSNAEISYFTNSSKEMWINLISMQTSDTSGGGGTNKEEYISSVAVGIQEKLPEIMDLYNIKKKYELPQPTTIVLLQELERFNMLLEKIHVSLYDLQRALNGEIGMSQELDDLSNSLFNGFLPDMWRILAPQTEKNLVNWIDHFERRYKQFVSWDLEGEPKAMWLSGLHIPESYLTALIQTTCRRKLWPLDKSRIYTTVTNMTSIDEVKKKPEDGCYVYGLYLEGAKWDIERNLLDYQDPKELVVEMPLVKVNPVEANKLKLRGTITTPVYVTQARRNSMGVGWVFDADLNTNKNLSHWVLQGVAVVLNTD